MIREKFTCEPGRSGLEYEYGQIAAGEKIGMSPTMAIVSIAILALVIFFVRRKIPAPDVRPSVARPAKAAVSSQFHAVSIKGYPDFIKVNLIS